MTPVQNDVDLRNLIFASHQTGKTDMSAMITTPQAQTTSLLLSKIMAAKTALTQGSQYGIPILF